jgi:hypothetical protein
MIIISFHFEDIPIMMSMENNIANGNAYNITPGACNKKYWTIINKGASLL